MIVRIPSPLFSYTGGRDRAEARGSTVGEVMSDLERQFPGLRFRIVDEQDRIRTHILVYVSGTPARTLAHPVSAGDEVMIVAALSGG